MTKLSLRMLQQLVGMEDDVMGSLVMMRSSCRPVDGCHQPRTSEWKTGAGVWWTYVMNINTPWISVQKLLGQTSCGCRMPKACLPDKPDMSEVMSLLSRVGGSVRKLCGSSWPRGSCRWRAVDNSFKSVPEMMQFLKTSSCSMLSSSLRAELLGGSREDVEGVVY